MANTFTDATTATGSRLVSVTEAKTHLGVSGSDDDTTIGSMLDAATETMEQFTGRHLISTTVTQVLDGTGKRYLWLKEPAESITSIKIDSDQGFDDATAEDSDDYRVDGCTVDHYSEIWTWGRRNIQVVYLAGFATIPDDIKQACKAQVAKMYADWQTVKEGANTLASESVQGWARKWHAHDGLDEEVKAILLRYKPVRL